MRTILSPLLLALLPWSVPLAVASPPPFPSARLEYRVAEGLSDCPSRDELAEQLSTLLHSDPWQTDPALVIDVSIYPKDAGIGATILLRRGGGEISGPREMSLPARRCRELGRTVALALAIALDPQTPPGDDGPSAALPDASPRVAPVSPRASDPARDGARAVPPPPPAARTVVESPRPAATWEIGGRIGVAVGLTPSPIPVIAVGPAVHFSRRLSVRLEALAGLPGEKEVSGGRIGAWLMGGGLLPCRRFGRLSLCASGWAALYRARGQDLLGSRAESKLWLALGGRAALAVTRISSTELSLVAEGLWSARRYRLVDSHTGAPFWRMPPLGATIGVAIGHENID